MGHTGTVASAYHTAGVAFILLAVTIVTDGRHYKASLVLSGKQTTGSSNARAFSTMDFTVTSVQPTETMPETADTMPETPEAETWQPPTTTSRNEETSEHGEEEEGDGDWEQDIDDKNGEKGFYFLPMAFAGVSLTLVVFALLLVSCIRKRRKRIRMQKRNQLFVDSLEPRHHFPLQTPTTTITSPGVVAGPGQSSGDGRPDRAADVGGSSPASDNETAARSTSEKRLLLSEEDASAGRIGDVAGAVGGDYLSAGPHDSDSDSSDVMIYNPQFVDQDMTKIPVKPPLKGPVGEAPSGARWNRDPMLWTEEVEVHFPFKRTDVI